MANFILLPATQTQTNNNTNPKVKDFLTTILEPAVKSTSIKLDARMHGKQAKKIPVKVLDSIQEDGAKLVELSNDELADFRFSYPGFRIIREKFYRKAIIHREAVEKKVKKSQINNKLQILVTDKQGNPLKDIDIVAFTNFESRTGDSGTTNTKGTVSLNLKGKRIQRMYVYPEHSYWGYYRTSFTAASSLNIALTPINTNYRDALRHFYPAAGWPSIPASIRVAVIDTGVGPHKDLVVSGGMNCVKDEDPKDYKDNGEGHGTHVAGIIGASGNIHGVAAGVEIFSYRVFPVGQSASNFYIMKAINQAILDKCDLINMSLGEAEQDEGIISYIKQAYNAGVLCFCANGNDDRDKVSFPASYSLSVAVSAMGRKKTFPPRTVQTAAIKAPYGKDKANFIADFSNIGPETDLTAPGVGIISTFPDDRYAIMDGTSMACPAATGMAARVLSVAPEILAMPRTEARADEMLKYLSARIRSLGFKPTFEGKGILTRE